MAQLLKMHCTNYLKIYIMKHAALILLTFFATIAEAQEQKTTIIPQISVTGEGKIKVTPDQAVVTVGVQNSGKEDRKSVV